MTAPTTQATDPIPGPDFPYGPGYAQSSSQTYATNLAAMIDQLNAAATYADDTYSPLSAEQIAIYWAWPNDPTPLQQAEANDFKAWLGTVKTMIATAMQGDVGYQIRKWRNAAPPGIR